MREMDASSKIVYQNRQPEACVSYVHRNEETPVDVANVDSYRSCLIIYAFLNRVPRHEGLLGEWKYNCTHSLTSTLDGAIGQLNNLANLHPVKENLVPIT
jgi:hypothetical protein